MNFRIPFTRDSINSLRKRHTFFIRHISPKKNSKFQAYLDNSDVEISREEYLSIAYYYFIFYSFAFTVLATTAFYFLGIAKWYLFGVLVGLLFGGFILSNQLVYPRVYANRKQRVIERNLIPALEDMLIQLNSGIPLFSILVNLSSSDYGALSEEFKKAVKKISAGSPQEDVLEELGDRNGSMYFRRTLWQISNGMKAGSDLGIVIRESIKSLNEEQLLQIQNYGNKLNPLIMFYMLISVIVPALSVTFLTILSSMVNLPQLTTILLFISLFVFVIIIQVMFLGIIKSSRPSLL
ncbi:MAG: type II secretion system F family protein [Nanoarchaeota archaeon]